METVNWKVDGITCSSCALSINKTLQKQGMQNIAINPINGNVVFDIIENTDITKTKKQVESLGYKVNEVSNNKHNHNDHNHDDEHNHSKYLTYFYISLPFTIILMLHMVPGLHQTKIGHLIMQPWIQFALALPVFLMGMWVFGKSAFKSVIAGAPNMNVLITMGALAAFGYSTYGLFTTKPENFMFFETAASIITIVFFGNWLEDWSVNKTQREIKKLTHQQVVMANMITYDENQQENIFAINSNDLRVGDLVLIKTGEQVPADCKILSGDAEVNEAIITGESNPLFKKSKDLLIGGSVISNGNVKCYITAVGENTIKSGIVKLMQNAQMEKPPVQQLADKISAIFIPAVLIIAVLTLVLNMVIGHHSFSESLMRSIAVLVISCPCAMGLATPAAIAVGLGRAAKYGILYTDVKRMELFKQVQTMVFDKTGTLTNGNFEISSYNFNGLTDEEFKSIVYSLEKFSNHPIAASISAAWNNAKVILWKNIEEIKGLGMLATDKENNTYFIGGLQSTLLKGKDQLPQSIYNALNLSQLVDLVIIKNNQVVGGINIKDQLRPEAKSLIEYCKSKNIKTILLSGDTKAKCDIIATELGITDVIADQTPEQKLKEIEELSAKATTVMVGDGINDAPALAKATISVSLAAASHLAIQSASVVLTQNGLTHLPKAIQLGKQTYNTVKSNLAWAFLYNVVAIPIAALGYLHPAIGALIMGGSDVVLALNSLWLGIKKLD